MLELKELAGFLTGELNRFAFNSGYSFNIFAEIGKAEPNTICGVLKASEPTITPINGIKNIRYNAIVELSVPAPTSNFNLINIENIIGKFIEHYNAKEVGFSNGKGLITFTFSRAKDYKMDYAVGETVPISFGVNVNYTENMVTSATKVWQIRPLDVENSEFITIPYLSESVLLEKGGKTNNISDALFQQTLLTSQIKYYRFEIPYETNDTLCSMLQKDILTGDFGKKYELRYYDGVSFLDEEEKDFRTTVSIFRTGDSSAVKPETAKFSITFADVDNGQNTIKYQMALIDNPFDSLSDNTQYFETQAEQQKYFIGEVVDDVFVPSELLSNGAEFDDIPAPNLNSLNITNQVYINTRKYDVFDLINKNYAIIKATNGDYTYFFYYRVNNGDIGANGQVSYNLTLDTIQTYLFDPRLIISGAFIQKSHLDRWVYNSDGTTVTFNGKADSKLFEREEIKEVAKRLIYRERLKFDTSEINLPAISSQSNSIFNIEKTPVWVYIFLDGQYAFSGQEIKYNFYNLNQRDGTLPQSSLDRAYSDNVLTPTAILAYPLDDWLFMGSIAASVTTELNIYTSRRAFYEFAKTNPTVFSHIKAIKLSIKPPINVNEISNYSGLIFIDDNAEYMGYFGRTIDEGDLFSLKTKFVITSPTVGLDQYALIYITNDNLTPFTMKFSNNVFPQNTFSKTDITGVGGVGVSKNKVFNPKINNADYKDVVINIVGSQYLMDYQKLNNRNPKFTYLEPLTCDTTRVIVRYKSENNNEIYNEYLSNSFSGLIYTNDLSLPIANDAFNNYLANNKNAYLSFQNQQQYAIDKTALSIGKTAVNTILDPTKLVMNGIGVAEQGIGLGMDLAFKQTQFDLSMDNMKAAPLMLSNANGSALFGNSVNQYGVYIELYEGLDTELEMANDIMFRDGYNYNRFDDFKSQLNIRHYFNYVKAIIGSLSGVPMSEESRKDFKQRVASGLRFWYIKNQPTIDYTKENYENSLLTT